MFCIRFFDVKLREDDLKMNETCQSISELYVKVYFYYFCLLVLPIKTIPLFTAHLIQLSSAILLGSDYEPRVSEALILWDVKRCPTRHNFH